LDWGPHCPVKAAASSISNLAIVAAEAVLALTQPYRLGLIVHGTGNQPDSGRTPLSFTSQLDLHTSVSSVRPFQS
jgi:hypothetical protein